MRPSWILVLATSGCRGILGIEHAIVVADAADDAAIDAPPDACMSWGPPGLDTCALGAPMRALHLTAGPYTYDTTLDGGTLTDGTGQPVVQSSLGVTQLDGSPAAVLSVEALTIDVGAAVRVVGSRPLIALVWSTAVIDGAIDASSHLRGPVLGANASVACSTGAAGSDGTTASATGGSGGGGGGGGQGAGGHGGTGGATPAPGGAGGAIDTSATTTAAIHGGCPGGASGAAGAVAMNPATRARGGAGGGAIRLIARDSIAVGGSISANGAGGSGAPIDSVCGGGGGGAGGSIALDAPAVTISGTVTANGGGGGGGGGALSDPGNDGSDGKVDTVAAPGGAGAVKGCGRPGGAGAALATLTGSDAPGADACGGGGGGGAVGFLRIVSPAYTATGSARISPPVIAVTAR